MKFLIVLALAAVAFAEPEADPQVFVGGLTAYANGARVPFDAANVAATNKHLVEKFGAPVVAPVAYSAYPAVHYIGKREAEADPQLVVHPNGAVVPVDTPANQIARAQHLTYKFGAAPYVYGAHFIGKREAQLVVHPDGAVTPPETPAVALATAQHYASKGVLPAYYGVNPYAVHLIGKREAEADPQLLVSPYNTLGYRAVAPLAYTTAYTSAYTVPTVRYIGKRSADADSQWWGYGGYGAYSYGLPYYGYSYYG